MRWETALQKCSGSSNYYTTVLLSMSHRLTKTDLEVKTLSLTITLTKSYSLFFYLFYPSLKVLF